MANLQTVARANGYALAVHGSMMRDLDLIAAPWTEDATDDETLARALCASCGGKISGAMHDGKTGKIDINPVQRPHGRKGSVIHFGDGTAYLDVSIMPRRKLKPNRHHSMQSTTEKSTQAGPVSGLSVIAGSASLADRCYASTSVEDELFNAVNAALGCNADECMKDGFVWGAIDTWWDEYDGSVEVVRPSGAEWMTRAQADAILAFGFGQIYESLGDAARVWSRTGFGTCSPREGSEAKRLRARIALLSPNMKTETDSSPKPPAVVSSDLFASFL